jgi:arabinose-5-phosphate isomerase
MTVILNSRTIFPLQHVLGADDELAARPSDVRPELPSMREFAREVIAAEAAAVQSVADFVGESFDEAVKLIRECSGALVTSGIGKAGHIARKLSASFASTGTPSHFLNPADALHGDLGSVRPADVALVLSYSGESDEILRLVVSLQRLGAGIIAITSTAACSLARAADVVLEVGKVREACPLGLAPTASTSAMLALGDALLLSVMKSRDFTADGFALYHPGGQLGRRLTRVSVAMGFRAGENLPVVSDRLTVGQVLHESSTAGSSTKRSARRRCGAVLLVDDTGRLSGIFTDGDLRRLITGDSDGSALKGPICAVMTSNPKRITGDRLASDAIALMRPLRIDDLPVVDDHDRPVGLIDIQDLVALKLVDVTPKA